MSMSYVYEVPVLTQIAQVHRHIEKHPGCTSTELMEELDLSQSAVNMNAQRLREQGKVRRVKLPGQRAVTWHPGREEGYVPRESKEGVPKQSTVSEWEPCTVQDPLIWMSFGVSPQPQEEGLL
jgi:hypothetical protein